MGGRDADDVIDGVPTGLTALEPEGGGDGSARKKVARDRAVGEFDGFSGSIEADEVLADGVAAADAEDVAVIKLSTAATNGVGESQRGA